MESEMTRYNYSDMDGRDAAKVIISKFHVSLDKTLKDLVRQMNHLADNPLLHNKILKVEHKFKSLVDCTWDHLQKEAKILEPLNDDILDDGAIRFISDGDLDELREEHRQITVLLDEITKIANTIKPADNDSALLKLFLAKLNNLEQDLRKDMYLENNLFFPKMMAPKQFQFNS